MNKKFLLLIAVLFIGLVYFISTSDDRAVLDDTQVEAPISSEATDTENQMTFFVTSNNPGTGANYGGLAGADAYCQSLASSAGAGEHTWRAYLSTVATGSDTVVNARDRIGAGPWHNAHGVLVANNVEELHSANAINKQTALSESGGVINGRGDTPNIHDILTGSLPDGTASSAEGDTTCENWTSEGEGSAIVGHHDLLGLDDSTAAKSWNSSHGSRGCSLANLNTTGGGGLLYCFASE